MSMTNKKGYLKIFKLIGITSLMTLVASFVAVIDEVHEIVKIFSIGLNVGFIISVVHIVWLYLTTRCSKANYGVPVVIAYIIAIIVWNVSYYAWTLLGDIYVVNKTDGLLATGSVEYVGHFIYMLLYMAFCSIVNAVFCIIRCVQNNNHRDDEAYFAKKE